MSSLQLLQQKKKSYTSISSDLSSCAPCKKVSASEPAGRRSCVDELQRILSPISDVLHLMHGPPACVACFWNNSRMALTAGSQPERLSFSTGLQDGEMEHGGKKKLYRSLTQLMYAYAPKVAFVYPSCLLDTDNNAIVSVCRRVEKENGVSVFPLVPHTENERPQSACFTACETLFKLVAQGEPKGVSQYSINILGELEPGGDAWTLKNYYEQMGVQVVAMITGDGKLDDIRRAQGARLNVVYRSDTFLPLAEMMQEKYGIPYIRESFFGLENTSKALFAVGQHFSAKSMILHRAQSLVKDEMSVVSPILQEYQRSLEGKNAGIYLKDAFIVGSLVEAFRFLGMNVTAVGVKEGGEDAYEELECLCEESVLLNNSLNPAELSLSLLERQVDVFIGEVQERKVMQKLGVGCCDYLYEKHLQVVGYRGMVNLARDLYSTIVSPVWKLTPRRRKQSVNSFLLPQPAYKRYQSA